MVYTGLLLWKIKTESVCNWHVSTIKSLLLWFRQQILTLKVNVQLKTLGHNILFSQKVQQITTHLVVNSSNIPVSALLHVCLDSSSKTQGQTAGDSHTDLEMKWVHIFWVNFTTYLVYFIQFGLAIHFGAGGIYVNLTGTESDISDSDRPAASHDQSSWKAANSSPLLINCCIFLQA